jgi:hypothetical protein
MNEHAQHGEVVTGLLYMDPLATDLHTAFNTCATPLNALAGGAAVSLVRWRAGQDQRIIALKSPQRTGARP